MLAACRFLSRHGKLVLIAGLIAGAGLPELAQALRPFIAPMIVSLLFLAVLRLGPAGLRAGMNGMHRAAGVALILQLALPVSAALAFAALGILAHPLAMGVILVLAAAPITGSPNITLMAGGDPAPALQQLVVGTALLPLTVIPVFWLMPAFGSPVAVARAALELLGLIALAGGAALALRHFRIVPGTQNALDAMDGLAALLLGLVVIGLMSAIGPAILDDRRDLLFAMLVVFALNVPLQMATSLFARGADPQSAPALGVVAGNRNIALFLSVLPAQTADQLLLFIGCFQVPMYVTPFLLARWYRWTSRP
jgi:ACR3 family arsenite transporter